MQDTQTKADLRGPPGALHRLCPCTALLERRRPAAKDSHTVTIMQMAAKARLCGATIAPDPCQPGNNGAPTRWVHTLFRSPCGRSIGTCCHVRPCRCQESRHSHLEQHEDPVPQRRVVPRAAHERRQRAQGAGVGWLQFWARGQSQEQLLQDAAPVGCHLFSQMETQGVWRHRAMWSMRRHA